MIIRSSSNLILFLYIFILSLIPQNITANSNENAVSVLCYHSFVGNKNSYSFSLQELNDQIVFFKSNGFKFISYNDLLYHKFYGRKNILITIDDGNKTVYDAYYKVLSRYNIKPLLAIYPAIIGRTTYGLTWQQLNDLVLSGCDIASHGLYHKRINSNLYSREKKTFNNEIFLSKRILEEKLNQTITAFVYPYGIYSRETLKAVKYAGYDVAFTVNDGPLDVSSFYDGAFLLPRYCLDRKNSKKIFETIVKESSGVGEILAFKKEPVVEKNEPYIPVEKKNTLKKDKNNNSGKSRVSSSFEKEHSDGPWGRYSIKEEEDNFRELITEKYYGESNYYSQKEEKKTKRDDIIGFLKKFSEEKKLELSKHKFKNDDRIKNFHFNYNLYEKLNNSVNNITKNDFLNSKDKITDYYSYASPQISTAIISKNSIKKTGQKSLNKIKNNFEKLSNKQKIKKRYLDFIVKSHINYKNIFNFFAKKIRNVGARFRSIFDKGKNNIRNIKSPFKKKF